jgi:hypothetical protein
MISVAKMEETNECRVGGIARTVLRLGLVKWNIEELQHVRKKEVRTE